MTLLLLDVKHSKNQIEILLAKFQVKKRSSSSVLQMIQLNLD